MRSGSVMGTTVHSSSPSLLMLLRSAWPTRTATHARMEIVRTRSMKSSWTSTVSPLKLGRAASSAGSVHSG